MKVLGISTNFHDSAVSLHIDNELVADYKEERFSRHKHHDKVNLCLEKIQEDFNFSYADPDVTITAASNYYYVQRTFLDNDFRYVDNKIVDIIKETGKTVYQYDHEFCHACAAYYSSGFFNDKTLIISFDGLGIVRPFSTISPENYDQPYVWDNQTKNVSVYSAYRNKIEEVYHIQAGVRSFNTQDLSGAYGAFLADLYLVVTKQLGFIANSEEGKVLGLSVKGKFNKDIYKILDKVNSSYSNLNYNMDQAHFYLKMIEKFCAENDINKNEELRADLAYNTQLAYEDCFLRFLNDIKNKFPDHTKLCLVGGSFANVKLNQKINELTSFEEVWVYPAMGDEGIAHSSAFAHLHTNGIEIKNKRIDNIFYGAGYTQKYMDSFINYSFEVKDFNPEYVSQILEKGFIVGVFQGRSEVGPRALGNRSILADPRKRKTHEYLNSKLQRNDIMPFAPIVMSEYISELCYAYKSIRTSEFMTMCYTVKDHWVDKIPAAIAPEDNSCRPQTVFKERHPVLHSILNEFYKLTGVPALVNTSFNAHGDPIINHPEHAVEYLNKGIVDYLILGNKIIKKAETDNINLSSDF